jgi:hypothetical protein
MNEVSELVLRPFEEIVAKAALAARTARDAQPILEASQSLAKEGERALKRLVPPYRAHFEKLGPVFIDALKENGMCFFLLYSNPTRFLTAPGC